MGDSKSATKQSSLAGKDDQKPQNEESLAASSLPSSKSSSGSGRRSSRKSVKKERKSSSDEAPESVSKKKKKKTKGGGSTSEVSSKESKIKAFASKGAGSKSTTPKASAAALTEKQALAEEKRKGKSSVIKSVVQPITEQTTVQQPDPSAKTTSDHPAPEEHEGTEAEQMQEEMLKEEQEDQALAALVLDLVRRKRKEKEEAAELVLSEAEIFKRSKNMSTMERAGIISILEETIAKLTILGYTHGKPVVRQEIKYVSLLDKLTQKEESALLDWIKSNKSLEEYEDEKHFIKLQRDRGFLVEALTLTLLEMKQKGTFRILQDIVHLEEEMMIEEADLRFNGKNRQLEVNHCKALLENERRRGLKRLDDRTAILARLKDEIQNVLFYNGLKFKYMDHWESSRAEQNAMMLRNKEKELERKLLDYEEMTSIEVRCNAEITAFIEENMKNLAAQVEEWMEKYESELEEREYKLNKLKEEREEHFKKLQEKINLFNERQKQMDDWKAYKERQRLEAEHLAYLNRVAVRIQAWWRGTMVRRCLGPYRKKKGRKGKRKKKK